MLQSELELAISKLPVADQQHIIEYFIQREKFKSALTNPSMLTELLESGYADSKLECRPDINEVDDIAYPFEIDLHSLPVEVRPILMSYLWHHAGYTSMRYMYILKEQNPDELEVHYKFLLDNCQYLHDAEMYIWHTAMIHNTNHDVYLRLSKDEYLPEALRSSKEVGNIDSYMDYFPRAMKHASAKHYVRTIGLFNIDIPEIRHRYILSQYALTRGIDNIDIAEIHMYYSAHEEAKNSPVTFTSRRHLKNAKDRINKLSGNLTALCIGLKKCGIDSSLYEELEVRAMIDGSISIAAPKPVSKL